MLIDFQHSHINLHHKNQIQIKQVIFILYSTTKGITGTV